MLVSFDALAQQFAGYTDVKGKIRREVQVGRLVQVARGLYETDAHSDGKYLAGAIYGPSYLSFDYALSVHALIQRGDIFIKSPRPKKRCATSCIRFHPCIR